MSALAGSREQDPWLENLEPANTNKSTRIAPPVKWISLFRQGVCRVSPRHPWIDERRAGLGKTVLGPTLPRRKLVVRWRWASLSRWLRGCLKRLWLVVAFWSCPRYRLVLPVDPYPQVNGCSSLLPLSVPGWFNARVVESGHGNGSVVSKPGS